MINFIDLVKWLEDAWNKKFTPYLVFIFGLLAPLVIRHELPELGAYTVYWLVGSVLFGLLLVGYWVYFHRVPKVPKGRIGFVIAITTDEFEPRSRVVRDFVVTLKKLLEESNLEVPFYVIELTKYHSQKITDAVEAKRYCEICQSAFLVYGMSTIRRLKGKEHYSIKLEGLVTHAPISNLNSKILAVEMNQVLPLAIKVSCENDLKGFETASICFSESAKFVIATAAMLSLNCDLALHLLLQLKSTIRNLDKLKRTEPAAGKLIALVPKRLAEVYFLKCQLEFWYWRKDRSNDRLQLIKENMEEFNKLRPNQMEYFINKAIWHFVMSRDCNAALKELGKCTRYIHEALWRYSRAFIYAYSGNMSQAELDYQAAFNLEKGFSTPFEVEEFIGWILQVEPDKYQMRYCLGLINFKQKSDYKSAKDDFENFLKLDIDNNYPKTKVNALHYIQQIDKIMAVA